MNRQEKSLSVILPCYNEESNLTGVVERCICVLEGIRSDYELIVVDDGSTDDTYRVASDLARFNARIVVIHHCRNGGYGRALRTGFGAAKKPLVFFMDADGQFDFGDIEKLFPLLRTAEIVVGYRITRRDALHRKINAFLFNRLVRFLFGLRVRDLDCAFKLIKREVLQTIRLSASGAAVNAELLIRAERAGFRRIEVGVNHYRRTSGEQTGARPIVVVKGLWNVFTLWRELLRETRARA